MGTLMMRNRRAGLSDAALIDRARNGDLEAYGKLFERHRESARALARQLSPSSIEADEAVSEAFERVLGAIRRGNGPRDSFRPYLLTAIRRTTYDRTRRESRATATSEEWLLDTGVEDIDLSLLEFERGALADAYRSLPERWQAVLWHTEIEETPAEELADMLGVKPNALAALAYRAREGLRQAYVMAHVDIDLTADDPECRWTVDNLPRYLRLKLNPDLTQQVDLHLDDCESCRMAYAEMAEVGLSLRAIFAPLLVAPGVLGGGVAGAGAVGGVALAGWGAGTTGAGAAGAGAASAGAAAVGSGAAGAGVAAAGATAATATAGVTATATVGAATSTVVAGVAAATVAATVGGALVLPDGPEPSAEQALAPAVAAPAGDWTAADPGAAVVVEPTTAAQPAGLAMTSEAEAVPTGPPATTAPPSADTDEQPASVMVVPEGDGEVSSIVIDRDTTGEAHDSETSGNEIDGPDGLLPETLPPETTVPADDSGSRDQTPDDEEPIGDIGEPLVITPPVPGEPDTLPDAGSPGVTVTIPRVVEPPDPTLELPDPDDLTPEVTIPTPVTTPTVTVPAVPPTVSVPDAPSSDRPDEPEVPDLDDPVVSLPGDVAPEVTLPAFSVPFLSLPSDDGVGGD